MVLIFPAPQRTRLREAPLYGVAESSIEARTETAINGPLWDECMAVAANSRPPSIAVIFRRISPSLCRSAGSGRFALVGFALVIAAGDPHRLRLVMDVDFDLLAPDDYTLFHFPPTGSARIPCHRSGTDRLAPLAVCRQPQNDVAEALTRPAQRP
jgi:hypothetical protein